MKLETSIGLLPVTGRSSSSSAEVNPSCFSPRMEIRRSCMSAHASLITVRGRPIFGWLVINGIQRYL